MLGQLQRGRGEGFLAARALPRPAAADLVWECIVHDPRYDRQVESRSEYYAALTEEAGLSVETLRPQNCPEKEPDTDQRLVVGVLGELMTKGVAGAADVLLDHVACGTGWDQAIYWISQSPGELYRQLPDVIEGRFPQDERVAIVHRWRRQVPWDRMADQYRWVSQAIDSLDDRAEWKKARPELPPMDRPAAELRLHPWSFALPKRLLHRLTVMLRPGERDVLIAALETPGHGRRVALAALARLDDPGGISVAEAILRVDASGAERAAALRYLKTLSAEHTLGLARMWLGEPDGRGVAAQMVFERHAEASDLPAMVSGLGDAWKTRDFYALCSFINALALLSDPGPLEQLATIYEEAEYSYARRRAARALIAIDKHVFVERYATPALWDCEPDVQELARLHSPP